MTTDLTEFLRHNEPRVRQHLGQAAGLEGAPEDGSDATLLIEALAGMAPEDYIQRFEESGRALALQGGRLEVRLEGIQTWSGALARVLSDEFKDDSESTIDALATLMEITAQAAVAITRGWQAVRSEQSEVEAERARRGITRMQALQRINAAANSTLDLDQTLATTAHAVANEMGADLCSIYLFDEVTRELALRATNGPRNSSHLTLALGAGYTGYVAEHGRPLLVPDALRDARFADEADAYDVPYSGLLSVPIIFFSAEKLEGVISVQTRAPHLFTEDEVSFLEIVAGQIAMSIENGRIYAQTDEELRRRVHQLNTLYRVSTLVASTLVFENVLHTIVAQAVQLSGADRSVLFELDPATQTLSTVASHGFERPEATRAVAAVGQCCVGRVVESGAPSLRLDCMRSDEGCFLYGHPEAIDDQHAVLCVPLTARQGPVGSLCIFSSQRYMLNEHQLQLVSTFANVAAIAMENARLFEQTREGLRIKETLLKEMHHRVKNNLTQIAGILNMRRRRTHNPEVQQVLLESVERIQGIAATHDLLSTNQLGVARIDEVARKIAMIVQSNLVPPQMTIRFRVNTIPYFLPTEEATTLAIVLNELIANAIEHGFEGRERGEIRISAAREGDHLVMRVADDGAGLPEDVSRAAEGLGLQLVRGLVETGLRGTFTLSQADGDPDIGERAEEGATDPALAALSGKGETKPGIAERHWIIAEFTIAASLLDTVEPASASSR
ncbi:MAG TPA: GAF domain-containing protein [Ktedonobacterales bacterium]|nr:GAF domain-containing protein [Ktedonobacterales bacterium]